MPEKKERKFGYSKWRRAWMQGHALEAAIYTGLPDDNERDGFVDDTRHFGADSVVLELRRGKTGVLFIDLTSLTEEELTLFRDVVNMAFDAALPACAYIDAAAAAAVEAGETFSPRPFRVRPVFHIRWDKTINIPDNNKENQHEQAGGKRPPEVEAFFTRPE